MPLWTARLREELGTQLRSHRSCCKQLRPTLPQQGVKLQHCQDLSNNGRGQSGGELSGGPVPVEKQSRAPFPHKDVLPCAQQAAYPMVVVAAKIMH